MKNHLKRIATPSTWIINRKQHVFTVKPNPGAHSQMRGLPLVVILRDVLSLARTSREVRKLLNNNEVAVDGTRRLDHRFIVGLFDVLSIPSLKKNYRLVLDTKGRLVAQEITDQESNLKLCKIVGKTILKQGKIQFNLHDGKNVISDKEAKVGDTFLLQLPTLEIVKVFPLKEGITIFLTRGKHSGDTGMLKGIKDNVAQYVSGEQEIETAKSYLFVVGEKEPHITVRAAQ